MKRRILLVGIGILAFALFLLARVPASVAFERLPAGLIQAHGLQGTIWSGQAEQVNLQGLAFGRTEWRWSAMALLRAEFAYQFSSSLDGHQLQGLVASTPNGTLRLVDVQGQLPLSALATVLPTGFFTGLVDLNVQELVLSEYWPARVDATLKVAGLSALTTNPATLLGDFQVVFDDQQTTPLQAQITDLGGPLNAAGQLTVGADRRFTLDLALSPTAEAGDPIRNMLRYMGQPDATGQHRLRHSGRL